MSATSTDAIRVVVVDDHEAVRAGLERLLERSAGLEAVGVLSDGEGLAGLLADERVDVVVLDYDLERGDGLAVCLAVKQARPATAVVIYSGYAGPGLTLAAAVAQADAVIGKAEPVEVLLDAIRRLGAGERLLGPPPPELLEAAAGALEPADLPLMALLVDRQGPADVAAALGLSERDVRRRARRVVGMLQGGVRR